MYTCIYIYIYTCLCRCTIQPCIHICISQPVYKATLSTHWRHLSFRACGFRPPLPVQWHSRIPSLVSVLALLSDMGEVVLPCLALSLLDLHSLMNLHSSKNCTTLSVELPCLFLSHLSHHSLRRIAHLHRLLCSCSSNPNISGGFASSLVSFSCVLLVLLFRSHTWPLRGHMHYDRHYRTLNTPRRIVRQLCDTPYRNTYCVTKLPSDWSKTPPLHTTTQDAFIYDYTTHQYSYPTDTTLTPWESPIVVEKTVKGHGAKCVIRSQRNMHMHIYTEIHTKNIYQTFAYLIYTCIRHICVTGESCFCEGGLIQMPSLDEARRDVSILKPLHHM